MTQSFSTKITLLALLSLFTISLYAQAPQAFKYQSIIRNKQGNPMANQALSIKATVHEGAANGTIVYQEEHQVLFLI